jgi:hypothetical protein
MSAAKDEKLKRQKEKAKMQDSKTLKFRMQGAYYTTKQKGASNFNYLPL